MTDATSQRALKDSGHRYTSTNVHGHGRVIQGDVYGDVYLSRDDRSEREKQDDEQGIIKEFEKRGSPPKYLRS